METSNEYLSLTEAAKSLGVNRTWLKGHLAALQIALVPVGKTLVIRREDLKRVKGTPKEVMA